MTLLKIHVTGDKSVNSETDMHSLCSVECQKIVLAMSNYDRPAQEQFMAQAVMAMMRLGVRDEDIRSFFDFVMKTSKEICEKNPFPCQRTESPVPFVSERQYYIAQGFSDTTPT